MELCSWSFFGIISYFEKVWKMPLLLKRFWLIKIVQLPVLCVWAHILYAEGLKIIAFQKYRYLLECLLLIFVTWGQQYLLHGATNIFYLGQIYLLHRAKYICYMGPTIVVVSNECYLKMLLFFKNVGLEVIKAIHIWTNLRSEFSDINPFICTVYWKCWDESENSPKIGKRKYNPELLWNLAIFVQVHYVIMWRCKEEEGREYVKPVWKLGEIILRI